MKIFRGCPTIESALWEQDNRIITTDESYVKASVSLGEKKVNASIRLKGDVVDHLEVISGHLELKLKGMNQFLVCAGFLYKAQNAVHG